MEESLANHREVIEKTKGKPADLTLEEKKTAKATRGVSRRSLEN